MKNIYAWILSNLTTVLSGNKATIYQLFLYDFHVLLTTLTTTLQVSVLEENLDISEETS